MIEIVIVDDDTLVRAGLRMMIETQDDLAVVGEAGNGEEAVRLVERLRPDIVLMDIRMPGVDGLEATRRIAGSSPDSDRTPRVVILTTFDLDEYVFEAVRAGASGFLLKRTPPRELLTAIRTVHDGDSLLSPAVTTRLMKEFARTSVTSSTRSEMVSLVRERLTDREVEVLIHVGQGANNREIADALYLSEHTVKTHLKHIMTKLDLRDRIHAVVLAYECGLVVPGGGA